MVVEPPPIYALSDPYEDEEGDDFPGIEKLFEDYVPGEYSVVSKPGDAPAPGKSDGT